MKLVLASIAVIALTACQSNPMMQSGAKDSGAKARADLEAKSGSAVSGHVDFTERGDKVLVAVKASGFQPNSEHGFHVHEKGDCSAPDAMSAGGHFNPDSQPHSNPASKNRHAGDMNAVRADSNGEVVTTFEVDTIRVDNGQHGILERAVVIHAMPDDYTTQPTGNSGGRIACGVIRKS